MSRRIPPSTVSVRRMVSDILNIALAPHAGSMRWPQMKMTVALTRRELQKLPSLFASGQRPPASPCEFGTYIEKAKPTEGQLRSRPGPKPVENEGILFCWAAEE